jgi:hypothetical protein
LFIICLFTIFSFSNIVPKKTVVSGDIMKIENGGKYKFYGCNVMTECFIKSSKLPIILNAKEVYIDGKYEILGAYSDVEVITPYGKIYSDNAVFYKKMLKVIFKKDVKRPSVDIFYNDQEGTYVADEMIFYNSDNNRKIIMNGSVVGKIEIKDEVR